ncbi:MAG TPA: hypothetical protein VNA69_07300 [Thermoanaerobaculia bacterium]|nr:hypothetical protein [Thermoanaerobaculia bacterium]
MRTATFLLAALLLASCGTGGTMGGLGDIILGSPSSTQNSDVQGYVAYVDTSTRRIDLDVEYINNLRQSDSSTQRGTIYYDTRTRVIFNGREYRPEDLERGDQISVKGYNDKGRYVAETIEVLRDVSR